MIFVTVGTTEFPFNRLLKAVDEAMIHLESDEELIVQRGSSDYKFKYQNIKIFKEIGFGKMIFYLKKARVTITHGGPATIFLALKYNRNLPMIIPRLKKFGEHTDDHQLFFVQFLRKRNLSGTILNQDNLKQRLKSYLLSHKQNVITQKSPKKKTLIKNLINFTKKLNEQK